MPIQLQCPGCRDVVIAQEDERGKSVKCATCGTSVPVPAGEGHSTSPIGPALARPPARTLPRPPTAPLLARAVPASQPATAPVIAVPVLAKPALKVDPKRANEKARFKKRDRTDDDGDEGDDDAPPKKGGWGLPLGLAAVAVLLVVGCGGLGYVFFGKTKTDTAATTPDGGGGDNPSKPKHWKAIGVGDGFAMDTPNGDVTKNDAKVQFGKDALDAKKYVKKDNGSTIQIAAVHCDLKGDSLRLYSPTTMVSEMFALPSSAVIDRGPRYIGDREAREFSVDRGGGHDSLWIAKVGDRVYGFQFHWENPEPASVRDIKEAFFRTLAIHYGGAEPFDPPPWNPGANPQILGPVPIEQPWVPLTNNAGFTAEAPKGVKTEKFYTDFYPKTYHGHKYLTEDPQCHYAAIYQDVPADEKIDLEKLVQPLLPFAHTIQSSAETKLDGKPATKWTIRHIHGGPGHGVSVRVGFRVFTFLCTSKIGLHAKSDPTHEERTEKFFSSIRIKFDPKTYAPFADEPAWAAMAKTNGFTAQVPNGTSVSDHRVGFARDEIKGTEYKSEDDGMSFQVFAYDLPLDKSIDKLVTEHVQRLPIASGSVSITIDGYSAEELTLKDHSKLPVVIRSVKVGGRAYIVKVARRYGKLSDMEFDARKAKFFTSFHIGSGGAASENPGPGVEPRPSATGEFVKAAKVLPFWASVVLPEKKELIALSVRDSATKPAGVLRRDSYPDFKLKATYQLPLPVNRVVADEKTGRLYGATVNVYDRGFSERELTFAPGDIQIFDLNRITDGKLAELEDLKPLATIPIGTRISGLEISPKDSALFVSAVTMAKDKAKTVSKGRLYKIDTDKQRVAGEIDSPDPVWSIRLSPDGGKLFAGGMPLSPGGSPLVGFARPTSIDVIDTTTWKRAKSLPLPAGPVEIALAGPRVLGLVQSKAEPSLLAVDEVGDVADLTPRGDVMAGARYIRTSADGKRLLLSSGGTGANTVHYYDVVLAAPPRLAKVASGNMLEGSPLGGHFVLSPDGKYALFNTGLVIDLEKTAGGK